MAAGDHFFVWRKHLGVPYQHHAIDIGDGTAVHFTDGNGGVARPAESSSNFVIQRTPMSAITRDGRDSMHIVKHRFGFEPEKVIQRAISQVGQQGYHFVFDNCEHFACWCVLDRKESRQVQVACERLSAVTVKALASSGVRMVSRFGTRRLVRGTNPAMIVSDIAQWATEAGGHHVGLTDPVERKKAGRAVGGAAALGLGAFGGPVGFFVAGGIWIMGEIAGEVSREIYENVREQRVETDSRT